MAYKKHEFVKGEKLYASQMNDIQDAIIENEKGVSRLEERVEKIEAGEDKTEVVLVGGWNGISMVSGYIDTNGSVVPHEYYVTSNYLPALSGTDIGYSVQSIVGTCYVIAFYDESKNFLPSASLKATGGASATRVPFSGTLTIPDGVAYFRIMDFKNSSGVVTGTFSFYKEVSKDAESSWVGKRWFAFGTSITDTLSVNEETGTPTGKYVPYLADMSGLVVDNHGISGGTIGKGGAYGGTANILREILSTDLSAADLITIEGFVNDFACSVSLGELGENTVSDAEDIDALDEITIRAALYAAIKHCLETAPNATVILLTESTGKEYTMTAGASQGTTVNYTVTRKNSIDLFQKDYNDAIIEMGRFMGVRVIDAGANSQINCFDPEYVIDQIHHTELGGKQYATVIWDELKNISPKVTE